MRTSSDPAVYYVGADGKRYVFPNSAAYFSWYADFAAVKTITAGEMASLAIGGNVTYRPGTRMVKIQTDTKVYAVSKGGVLRHVGSESIATCLFGANWNVQIDDVPDAFFIDYRVGDPISNCVSYDTGAERVASPTIGADKGLEAAPSEPPPATPTFSASSVVAAPGAGKQGVLMELRLRTAPAVRIRQLTTRIDATLGAPTSGQGADSDLGGLVRGANERLNLTNVRWIDEAGNTVFGSLPLTLDSALDQQQTLEFAGTRDVPAGSDVKLRLVADFDADIPSGESFRVTLPATRLVLEDAFGNPHSFLPTGDIVGPTLAVGKASFEVSVDPIGDKTTRTRGAKDVPLFAFTFRAGSSADAEVRGVTFQGYIDEQEGPGGFQAGADADNGTATRVSDLVSSVRLVDEAGTLVAGPVTVPFDGRPVFSGLHLAMPAGTSKALVLRGDLKASAPVEEHDDRLSFDIVDVARDVLVYGPTGAKADASGTAPNGGATPRYALTIRKHGGLTFDWSGRSLGVVAGREDLAGTLKISAAHDAFDVTTLTMTSFGETRAPLDSLRLSYVDAQGASRSAEAAFSGNDATFTGLALRVPRDGSADVYVYARLAATSASADSGKLLRVGIVNDRPLVFSSSAEARAFDQSDLGNGAFSTASSAANLTVRLTDLKAQRAASSPSGTIARGKDVEVLRFTLTTGSEGPARIKKLTFRLKPGDVGREGSDNDALERWADVNGDAADDNDVIEFRRFLPSGSETLGEDLSATIRYGIVRNGVLDATPQGLDSAYGDEGQVEIEFADGQAPTLAAGAVTEFSLSLKTDSVAVVSGTTLEARLLGAETFVWADVTDGFYKPLDGFIVQTLPIASPTLTLP